MKHRLWLLALLPLLAAVCLGVALAQSPAWFRAYGGQLVAGTWLYEFLPRGVLTPAGQKVTDYAFAPGRGEVAFLGPRGEASALWLTRIGGLDEARRLAKQRIQEIQRMPRPWSKELSEEFWGGVNRRFDESPVPPRVLWTAPSRVQLTGPIVWAPDGNSLLVRARRGKAADLVAVGYVTGKAVWLTKGANVVTAVYPPTGGGLAYVTEEHGKRRLFVRPSRSGEAKPVGEGGWNLRWSDDGNTLRWLAPLSATFWAEMEWDGHTAAQIGTKPARPSGATWSPDNRWCAALVGDTEKKLFLWPAGSERGEEVALPGLHPQRLLNWSPDSNLLLLLAADDSLCAVIVDPPAPRAFVLTSAGDHGSPQEVHPGKARARLLDWVPMQADAGPPAWSSGGQWLIYTASARPGAAERWQRAPGGKSPAGRLFALQLHTTPVDVYPKLTPELERTLELNRMKNVAMALQMYLADYDRVPATNDQKQVMGILDEYVQWQDIFMNPRDPSQPVVKWLFDPGASFFGRKPPLDPAQTALAIIDYNPAFSVIAYGDGHAVLTEGPAVPPPVTLRKSDGP